jgi:hypothetical protein
MSREFQYNLRTVVGFLLIAVGVAGSLYLGWWLIFRGNIVETIHTVKMSLPPWVWLVLKLSLSVLCAILFLSFFLMLAVMVFAYGRKKRR